MLWTVKELNAVGKISLSELSLRFNSDLCTNLLLRYFPRNIHLPEVKKNFEAILNNINNDQPRKGLPLMSQLLKQKGNTNNKRNHNHALPPSKEEITSICGEMIKSSKFLALSLFFTKKIAHCIIKCRFKSFSNLNSIRKFTVIAQDKIFIEKLQEEDLDQEQDEDCVQLDIIKALLVEALTGDYRVALSKLHDTSALDLPVLGCETDPDANIMGNNQVRKMFTRQVNLENFMGSNPVWLGKKIDAGRIETEMILSTPPEQFKKPGTPYKPLKKNISVRYIRRANLLISILARERIIAGNVRMARIITDHEKEEGTDFTMCKKSLERIYKMLVDEGYIKIVKVIMRYNNMCRVNNLICSPQVTLDNPDVCSILEQMKLQYFLLSRGYMDKNDDDRNDLFETHDISSSVKELKQLNYVERPKFKLNQVIGKEYGYAPKFMRMQALHELLFHTVYVLNPNAQPLREDQKHSLFVHSEVSLSDKEISELPPIYTNTLDWRMFIPPLPTHKSCDSGWTLICDIILRLPLSLFVRLHKVRFVIPNINTYLKCKVRKHLLIKYLPTEIRSGILYKRMYITDIYDSLRRLGYIGLIQFGQQKYKEKDQSFVYVNRKAVLYDTTSSNPGYHQVMPKDYEKQIFNFVTAKDVERYWYQMWIFCMNTRLGHRNALAGTSVVIEPLDTKPAMLETTISVDPKVAAEKDVGYLPGDHLGAAGLDSALFSYIKSNWMWAKKLRKMTITKPKESITGLRKHKLDKLNIKPIKYDELQKTKVTYENLKRSVKKDRKQIKKKPSGWIKKKNVRAIMPRKKIKKRKLYFDKIDKQIIAKLKSTRTEWSRLEDLILFLCKVAVYYLCPSVKKPFIIPYTTIRDVLHRTCPISRNKTSRACQRRMNFLFSNHETEEGSAVSATNLNNLEFVRKYFSKFRNKSSKNIKEKDQISAFIYLVYYLSRNTDVTKVTIENGGLQIVIDYLTPRNINKFTVKAEKPAGFYFNPQNETDVMYDTLKSIMHSATAYPDNNVVLAFQLFRIYKTFPEMLLRQVSVALRDQQIIASKRRSVKKTREGRIILPCPFQFSCTYIYSQITDFPVAVYKEAYEFHVKLNCTEPIGKLSFEETDALEQGHNCGLSEMAMYIKIQCLFDIPKQTLVLNPDIDDHTELINELALRYQYFLTKKFNIEADQDAPPLSEAGPSLLSEPGSPPSSEGDPPDKKRKVKPLEPPHHKKTCVTIEDIIQKVIKAYDCKDKNEKLQLEMAIQNDMQVMQNESNFDYDEDIENDANDLEKQSSNINSDTVEPQLDNDSDDDRNSDVCSIADSERFFNCDESEEMPTLNEIKAGMMDSCENTTRKVPHITELYLLLSKGLFRESAQFDDEDEWLDQLNKHFVTVVPQSSFLVGENLKENAFYRDMVEDHITVSKILLLRLKKYE